MADELGRRDGSKPAPAPAPAAPAAPPTFAGCGKRLSLAFVPLEDKYSLSREDLEDDVKTALLGMDDAIAAACIADLFDTLGRQQLESPIDWLKDRIKKAQGG